MRSLLQLLTRSERRSALILLGAAIVGAVLGVVIYSSQDRTYRAEALLMIAEADPQGAGAALGQTLGGLSALAGINLRGATDRRQKFIAFLRSRDFTARFIERHGLADDLFPERWDEASRSWRPDTKAPTSDDLFARFDREVRDLKEDKFSGLLTLNIDWHDRTKIAQWANSLVRDANEELRAQAINEARTSIAFLESELERDPVLELRQSIYRLMEAQVNAVMLANARKDYAFQVLDPAVTPDENKFIRPRLVIMVAMGMLAFAGLATGFLFLGRLIDKRRAELAQQS